MRRLEGVIDFSRISDADDLKKYSLFFDKLHLVKVQGLQHLFKLLHRSVGRGSRRSRAELKFLEERALIATIDENAYLDYMRKAKAESSEEQYAEFVKLSAEVARRITKEHLGGRAFAALPDDRQRVAEIGDNLSDCYIRLCSIMLAKEGGVDVAPICLRAPQESISGQINQKEVVLEVALQQFPIPGPTNAWENILEFRQEMEDQQWLFRRFLNTLATKKQTEAEIKDDIEWTLNEYTEGLKRRHIKIVRSAVAALIVPAIDFTFNASGNHAAALLAAGIAINRLRVELMEGEMKAPGRECAYVFEA